MFLTKDQILDFIIDKMSDKEKEVFKLYYECNRSITEMVKTKDKKPTGSRRQIISNMLYKNWKLRLAISFKDMCENDLKQFESPSPEWLIQEQMKLYKEADNTKDKKDFLKELKDLQYKFGESLDDDVYSIMGLTLEQDLEIAEDLVRQLREYISTKKWWDKRDKQEKLTEERKANELQTVQE
jgi:hypothetical protein